jgi:putative flippase GtrA
MISQKRINLSLLKQLCRFGFVGVGAMIVHWCTAVALVPLGLQPLVANSIGFLVAFQCSYLGHRYWTFPVIASTAKQSSYIRFFITALSGFAVNQLLFTLLLQFTDLDYRMALLIVLVLVAFSTFIVSKFWAFRLES